LVQCRCRRAARVDEQRAGKGEYYGDKPSKSHLVDVYPVAEDLA